jgi:putative cell wall-binding protein
LIIGGISVVSSGDESWLKANVTSNVVRKSGATRYDTSAAVAQFCIDEGMSVDVCAVATGQDYVDALVAGPMQAKANGPIVLVAANTNKGYKYASRGLNFTAFQNVLNNGNPEEIRFMGGHLETSPVPQSSRDKMVAMIN